MKKSNTLVMTVNYEGAKPFVSDFLQSIKKQDTHQYDLLIINDNFPSIILKGLNVNVNEIIISERMQPSTIRYKGLIYAVKNNYQYIIFSDIDDSFTSNRISLTMRGLEKYDFVFNEISLIDVKGNIIGENYLKKLSLDRNVESYNKIIDYNFLGLTHTGINLNAFCDIFIPKNIIAVDWWIYTLFLLNGSVGKFIANATTFYRQFDANLVGMKKRLDEERLRLGIKVKQIHYQHAITYCCKNNLKIAVEDYRLKKKEMDSLKSHLNNRFFLKKYIKTINHNIEKIYKGWWSEIIPIPVYEKYENTIN